MQQGQKLNDSEGNQVALFPLDYMYITQGEFGEFSHQGSRAIDFVGRPPNRERYPYYAPVDLKMVYHGGLGSYYYESLEPVRWVNGTLDYITVWVVHDDTDYPLGRIVQQGGLLGRTGTTGYVTGDHAHIEVAQGKFAGGYHNEFDVFMLHNQVSMINVFAINDTDIDEDYGYNWKSYTGGVIPPDPTQKKGLPIWLMGQKIR